MQAIIKEFHESVIEKLTPGNKSALSDYWRVSCEQDEIINKRVLSLAMQHPDFAAYIATAPTVEQTKQIEDNKINVR